MSDTPCVDGCGQDAATIERLTATLARVERLADEWEAKEDAHLHPMLRRHTRAARLRAALRPVTAPLAPSDADQVSVPTEGTAGAQAGVQQEDAPDARP